MKIRPYLYKNLINNNLITNFIMQEHNFLTLYFGNIPYKPQIEQFAYMRDHSRGDIKLNELPRDLRIASCDSLNCMQTIKNIGGPNKSADSAFLIAFRTT